MLSLAAQTNAIPLPSVQEVFGVRMPSSPHVLTQVDFDLVPNRPPMSVTQYDEEVEEVEESSDEEDMQFVSEVMGAHEELVQRPFRTPSDTDMASPSAGAPPAADEGSDGALDEDDGLFAGGDDESDGDDVMESVEVPEVPNGIKRKLVEEEDYD